MILCERKVRNKDELNVGQKEGGKEAEGEGISYPFSYDFVWNYWILFSGKICSKFNDDEQFQIGAFYSNLNQVG